MPVYAPQRPPGVAEVATEGEDAHRGSAEAARRFSAKKGGRRPHHEKIIDVAAFDGGGRGQNSPQGRLCQGGNGVVPVWK